MAIEYLKFDLTVDSDDGSRRRVAKVFEVTKRGNESEELCVLYSSFLDEERETKVRWKKKTSMVVVVVLLQREDIVVFVVVVAAEAIDVILGLEACCGDSGRKGAKGKTKDHKQLYSASQVRVVTALQPHSNRTYDHSRDLIQEKSYSAGPVRVIQPHSTLTVAKAREAELHLTLKCGYSAGHPTALYPHCCQTREVEVAPGIRVPVQCGSSTSTPPALLLKTEEGFCT